MSASVINTELSNNQIKCFQNWLQRVQTLGLPLWSRTDPMVTGQNLHMTFSLIMGTKNHNGYHINIWYHNNYGYHKKNPSLQVCFGTPVCLPCLYFLEKGCYNYYIKIQCSFSYKYTIIWEVWNKGLLFLFYNCGNHFVYIIHPILPLQVHQETFTGLLLCMSK